MAFMDLDDIPAWLDARNASGDFSGVALVARDGETLFSHMSGLAHRGHGVPNRLDTRFAAASIGKLPLAIAALRLVERGELDLHRPLTEVLPPEHRPAALTSAHTLHHLLSHTSGLASYLDDDDETWDSWNANWDRIPVYHARRPADLLPLFAELPARHAPGEVYEYNDAGFVLAGLVVEAATGRRWDEVLADEVLTPAGMADTSVEELDSDPARLAVGYVVDDGPVEARRTNIYSVTASPMPDGGMLTTAADLVRLVDALLAGRLLGEPMLREMLRPQGPPSADVEQYGYGCQLAVEDGRVTIIGHGGSDPGVATMLVHHLEARTTIVVLCNQDRGAWGAMLALTEALGLRDPRA
jgi:CubicO group peptidase (beta-lactamase class C family)